MGLPPNNITWPPPHTQRAHLQVQAAHTWLEGNSRAISAHHHTQPVTSPYQHNGGITGIAARTWLGKPRRAGSAEQCRHLPVPAALCEASASMLVGDPPSITLHPDDVENVPAAQCLNEVTTPDSFAAELQQAAYNCAGLGWIVGRVAWDTSSSERPWIQWVDPDQCSVTFRFGRAVEITFWDRLPNLRKMKGVYRLVQSHSVGLIAFGLYCGTEDNLGRRVPFTDHPGASYLTDVVDENGWIHTGATFMTAAVIVNSHGATEWRTDPQLKHLGKSDIAKGGDLWADIDRLYTELMLEYEAGKAKLLVSEELLDTGVPGQGQLFNFDRTVFPVGSSGSADTPPTVQQVQFQLRVNEFLAGLNELQLQAVSAVGLSPITVGLDSDNSALTATEITARSRKTLATWKSKSRFWRAGLSELCTALLEVDAMLHGTQSPTRPVNVSLRPPVENTELDEARTIGELRSAGVASLGYCVERLHPEWTPEQVEAEVTAIRAEIGTLDPYMLPPDMPPVVGE